MTSWTTVLFATSLAGAVAEEPADIVAIALGERDETIIASVVDDHGRVAITDAIGDTTVEVSFATELLDLAASRDASRIVVLRTDALLLLEPTLAVVWEQRLPEPIDQGHVALGEDGTIAIATDGRVRSIDAHGRARFDVASGLDEVTALTVSDDGLVVTGGARRSRCDARQAALVAREASGAVRWDLWSTNGCDMPMAGIVDVERGADGELYVLGDADGPGDAHARVAVLLRVGADGSTLAAGTLGFTAPYSTVRADALATDDRGNVLVVGASTHEMEDGREVESSRGVTGFYRMLASDLRTEIVSRQFDVEDLDGDRTMLVVDADRAVAMIPAVDDDPARIVLLPTTPDMLKKTKTPDRDDVGTFGYESGASGIEPTCYCDARRELAPAWWAASIAVLAFVRPRRRIG